VVKEIFIDCDSDTILLLVEQIGGACCHEGYRTCFSESSRTESSPRSAKGFQSRGEIRGKMISFKEMVASALKEIIPDVHLCADTRWKDITSLGIGSSAPLMVFPPTTSSFRDH